MSSDRCSYKLFYIVFFMSGACSLAYEVIWVKMFTPIFGIGLYSASTVVTSFMGGFVFGSYIFGKIIDHKEKPLKYYAFLCISIGAYAYILPLTIDICSPLMPLFYNNLNSNLYIYSIFRFFVAFVLLIFPTMLIGATLPVMSRFLIIASSKNVERQFSLLYAVNTIGAVTGSLLAGFFMIERFGLRFSSYIFGSVDILIGVFSYWYSSKSRINYTDLSRIEDSLRESKPRNSLSLAIFAVAFISGFCSLSCEILWLRALVSIIRRDIYLFPIILVTFLTGISLGSFCIFTLMKKIRHIAFVLGALMIAGGVIVAISFVYLSNPLWKDFIYSRHIYGWLTCFIVVFPSTFIMGMLFPLIVGLHSSGYSSIGQDLGEVNSLNTLGAMFGSFLTGFIFIPFCGLRNTLLIVIILYIFTGWLSLIRFYKKRKFLSSVCVILTLFCVNMLAPSDIFKNIFIKRLQSTAGKLLFYKEGLVSSVAVTSTDDDAIHSLVYSDRTAVKAESYSSGIWTTNHRLKAHIPMILHKKPRKVLNIGFGTGITAHSIALHDSIERMYNVEICKETLEAAPFFFYDLDRIFNNPKVKTIVDDGRNFLFVSNERFDIIFIYPFNAIKFEGNIYFYTKDFLDLCKAKLNDDGFVALWFPVDGMGQYESLALLKTFIKVFPNPTLWSTFQERSYYEVGMDGILIGNTNETDSSLLTEYLDKRFSCLDLEAQRELRESGIYSVDGFMLHRVSDTKSLRELSSRIDKVITDDHTFLDYRFAKRD